MQVHSPTSTMPARDLSHWSNRPRPPRLVTYRYANVPLYCRQPATHSLLQRTSYPHHKTLLLRNGPAVRAPRSSGHSFTTRNGNRSSQNLGNKNHLWALNNNFQKSIRQTLNSSFFCDDVLISE